MKYDAIVIGIGGMGSAALFHLARRGARVLGLEQFDLLHARGSSHGVNAAGPWAAELVPSQSSASVIRRHPSPVVGHLSSVVGHPVALFAAW